jgi:outer membrane protein assembly factor BamB
VNATGLLTGVSAGIATVTARLGSVSTTQTVSVLQPGAGPVPGDAYAYQINASHTGQVTFPTPLAFPNAPSWSVQLPLLESAPIITASSVFVLSSEGTANNSGASMYAFDASTGRPQWAPVVLTTAPGANFAYGQGRLVTFIRNCTMQGYDAATGKLSWSVDLSNNEVWQCGTVPTVYRGIAYVVGSGVESTVFAVDIANGKPLWATKIIGNGTAPAVTDDGVYVSGYLQAYKLDPLSGALLWHYVGRGFGGGSTIAAVNAGQVYMRGLAGTPNLIFDAQTSLITGTFTSTAIPAFGNGAAYFLDAAHALKATSLSGQALLWTATDPGSLVTAPLVVNNVVISGTATGLVKAYDASSGSMIWSVVAASPTSAEASSGTPAFNGMAAGHGLLAVAASNLLSVFRMTGP